MQMAEPDPNSADSWRNNKLRSNVLSKIHEAMQMYGNQATNKSPTEMERHIFAKARSKEEYLSFVAKLIHHFKESSKKNIQQQQGSAVVGQQQQVQMVQQQQQINMIQQRQQQQQNQQLTVLQQQQLKAGGGQPGMTLAGQPSQMANMQTLQQLQQQQSQQQLLQNANLVMNNMPGHAGPNGVNKMSNTMLISSSNVNSGQSIPNNGGPDAIPNDVPNMLNIKTAKQINSQIGVAGLNSGPGGASNINSMPGMMGNNFNNGNNVSLNLNSSNVNNVNLSNLPSSTHNTTGVNSNLNTSNSNAPNLVSNMLNSNMKQKLVSNMMSANAPSNNLNGSNMAGSHVTIGQLQQGTQQQQIQSGTAPGQQNITLQQLTQHHHQPQVAQQQQSNRLMQPNGPNMPTMIPNTRMMLNQGLRQQQPQASLTPNLQAQLRLRQPVPGGPGSSIQQTMASLQQQQAQLNTSLPIFIQQQQQQSQQQQPNLTTVQQQQSGQDKFFEISSQGQQHRLTPVTVSQQFKSGIMNSNNSGFVGTFTPNLNQNQQHPSPPQPAPARQINVTSNGLNSQNTSSTLLPPNDTSGQQPSLVSTGSSNKPQGPQNGPNKLLSVPTANTVLSGQTMINSPSNFHVSSPASVNNAAMMPSPASRQPHSIESLSPQSSTLNTPASVPPRAPSTNEDQLYMEKLQSMQKYLEPLLKTIQQNEKDDPKSKDVDKMKNLYQILTGASRCTISILERCEKFLENFDKFSMKKKTQQQQQANNLDCSPASSIPSVPSLASGPGATGGVSQVSNVVSSGPGQTNATGPTVASNKIQDIFQPLIEAVTRNSDKPMYSHTIHRTLGPALAVLHPEPYQSTNRANMSGNYVYYSNTTSSTGANAQPQSSKRKNIDTGVSDVLQGEIARLDIRFKVQALTTSKRLGLSNFQHLLCRLDDTSLPCVPPIIVYIAKDYPDIPPLCSLEKKDYETSNFFIKIFSFFNTNLLKLQGSYSLTALLYTWERSVRQAVCFASDDLEKENIL